MLICVADAAFPAAGEVVVSNTYENFSAERDLEDVPVTLSRLGVRGDFTEGITPMISARKLPAQVDVLRRAEQWWNDVGILEPGIIHPRMPGTGGRWEMEPYPSWPVFHRHAVARHGDGNGPARPQADSGAG